MNREICGQCGARVGLPAGEIDDLAQEVIEMQDETIAKLKHHAEQMYKAIVGAADFDTSDLDAAFDYRKEFPK